jgi:hypothetical protein
MAHTRPLVLRRGDAGPWQHLVNLHPLEDVIILLPQSIAKRRHCDSFCFTRTRRVAP